LKGARGDGEVLATFIVDTLGNPELASLKILKSTGPLFTAAVRDALRRTRYVPAQKGGVKVRELVHQSFVFNIARKDRNPR
jgi:protein TonB